MIIWKFPLEVVHEQFIEMPLNASILSCQLQDDVIMLWALCQDTAERHKRRILIRATGRTFNQGVNERYVASIQIRNNELTSIPSVFVWHVFDGGAVK